MPKFKVKGGNWGEGYQPGAIIEMDTDAAVARLAAGEIEPTEGKAPVEKKPKVTKKKKE